MYFRLHGIEMKRGTSISSRMSNYGVPDKKTAWKWTPAKIAAFSMFGLLTGSIVYFESGSDKINLDSQTSVISQPLSSIETSDFDKEYEDFLKRGKKIVSDGTLDSINQVQKLTQSKSQLQPTSPSISQKPRSTEPANRILVAPASKSKRSPNRAENNLELIELIPPLNSSNSSLNQGQNVDAIQGSTYSGSSSITNSSKTTLAATAKINPDISITEEFYIEETITGSITRASDRTAIQGATIKVKGTSRSVITDAQGRYSIIVPGDPQYRTLLFSFRSNTTERDVSPGTNKINIRF